MSLNEQLAELVMGWTYDPGGYSQKWTDKDGNDPLGYYFDREGDAWQYQWNPAEGKEPDLNQLRMCYEAAEKDDDRFAFMFGELLLINLQGPSLKGIVKSDMATAWVKHPELVAQAILKAKGVS